MSEWREREWRIARKGEVVRDLDGNIGKVTKTTGTLETRFLWVENLQGTEIYSGEDSRNFFVLPGEETTEFNLKKLDLLGFKNGALCSYQGNLNVPLEIVHLEWNLVRDKPFIGLKDLRKFNGEIMKTENLEVINPFDLVLPPLNGLSAPDDSGLRWRLEISLIDTRKDGWHTAGSPWEFSTKEDAISEMECWKSRLKIRRLASVINGDWKVEFPCWQVESITEDNHPLFRVSIADKSTGNPGFFKTALHAATALKMLDPIDWERSFFSSQDRPSI